MSGPSVVRGINSIKRPRSPVAVLITVFTLAACGNGGQDPAAPATEPRREDPSVEEFLDDTLPDGASGTVVAARDGEIAHCRGFGLADREAKVAAGCDTAYDIMSMTKQFTAAAILKLEMMGKLSVSDPMSEFVGPVPDDKRAITVHHLLTHTSGLTDQLGGDYEALSREEMLDGALESELRSAPGTEYSYSNLGYSILAAIVEKASGTSYERFLASHLFEPAGMRQTGYVLPAWKPDQVAVEYDENGEPKGKPFDHPWAEDGPYWNLRGNGGLLSTARDMFRWHAALEGDQVLSESAKDKMFESHVPEEEGGDSYYGYGWVVSPTDEGRIVWHDGGNGWSFGVMARFADQDTVVFWVSNHAYNDGEWNLENLAQRLTLGIAERVLDDG
ncbi:MAG TPA: serine hydrolase domain-containing protein [Rubrobacter sp.]|nr:serine hydrolase domain-containing protein [Rubrobacter sp.]